MVPADGAAGAFLTREGVAAGLPRRLLDSGQYLRPFRGVRTTSPSVELVDRARDLLPVLRPDAAFSHVTAAQLHDLPLSNAIERDDRLHFVLPIDAPRVRRPGTACHRVLHERSLVEVQGLRVVDLPDVWVDLGELLGRGRPVGLDDLIVVGDAIASRLASVQPLAGALAKRVRPRGKRALAEALLEIRVGSRSPRETLTRVMLTRCGIPEPRLNQAVISTTGDFLGVADLSWEEQRVVGEYQGEEYHSEDDQQVHDDARRTGFERDGRSVLEVWKSDLASTDARRACVLRFAEALGCDRSTLNLANCEPRFFSSHALDLALQRDERWRGRRGW
jgi:hypothetical protein